MGVYNMCVCVYRIYIYIYVICVYIYIYIYIYIYYRANRHMMFCIMLRNVRRPLYVSVFLGILYIYIYIYMCVYIYIYIYTYVLALYAVGLSMLGFCLGEMLQAYLC